MTFPNKKILASLEDIKNNPIPNVSLNCEINSNGQITGVMIGPENTLFDSKIYSFIITVPVDYPFKPFEFHFDPPIYHPNICPNTGRVHVDILKDQWSPTITLNILLNSISSLLDNPNTFPAANLAAAKLLEFDPETYQLLAGSIID